MGPSGDAGLAQNEGGKQSAEPGRMLQDGQLIPAIVGHDRLQHSQQVLCLPQDAAPFVQPRLLVPVEIVDQRIGRSPAGLPGVCNGHLR